MSIGFLSADGEVPTGSSIGRQRGANLQVYSEALEKR
jgi:hypothetical protein